MAGDDVEVKGGGWGGGGDESVGVGVIYVLLLNKKLSLVSLRPLFQAVDGQCAVHHWTKG